MRGPVLKPPCSRQRPFRIAGHWHEVPRRVFAPHRGAVLKSPDRLPYFSHPRRAASRCGQQRFALPVGDVPSSLRASGSSSNGRSVASPFLIPRCEYTAARRMWITCVIWLSPRSENRSCPRVLSIAMQRQKMQTCLIGSSIPPAPTEITSHWEYAYRANSRHADIGPAVVITNAQRQKDGS